MSVTTEPETKAPTPVVASAPIIAANGKRSGFGPDLGSALVFLAPNFLGFAIFTLFPVVFSFVMSLTNWTLKPAVKLEFLGLRNFADLVGLRAVEEGNAALMWGYIATAAFLALGVVGVLWANVAVARGARLGSLFLVGTGFWLIPLAFATGSQGAGILGGLCVVGGMIIATRTKLTWAPGIGTVPGVLIAIAGLGMHLLNAPMWEAYAARDERFWYYLYNTAYLMIGMPFGIAGSLFLAVMLNNEFRFGKESTKWFAAGICLVCGFITLVLLWGLGQQNLGVVAAVAWVVAALGCAFNVIAFRTIFYLPSFTAGVALLILWKALLNPETGPINVGLAAVFGLFGLDIQGPQWLSSVEWAKPALIMMGIWTGIGGTTMLLYLAALSNVQPELIDAAEVDGAGAWRKFASVVWPQLAPTTFFISIMAIIGGLQGGFEQARVMTGGGPAGSTTTLSYYIYNKAFQDLDLGYAASISWVLFAVIFIATLINWKFGRELEVE